MSVITNQSAIHLYEKFGFQAYATYPRFFKIGNTYADVTFMRLDLQ